MEERDLDINFEFFRERRIVPRSRDEFLVEVGHEITADDHETLRFIAGLDPETAELTGEPSRGSVMIVELSAEEFARHYESFQAEYNSDLEVRHRKALRIEYELQEPCRENWRWEIDYDPGKEAWLKVLRIGDREPLRVPIPTDFVSRIYEKLRNATICPLPVSIRPPYGNVARLTLTMGSVAHTFEWQMGFPDALAPVASAVEELDDEYHRDESRLDYTCRQQSNESGTPGE